jgi:hypothetical protein
MEAALAEHHRMLVRYLAPALRELRADPRQNPNARDKLVRLSASQFQELSTDVYDELTRREDERRRGGPGAPGNPVPKHLLPRQNFHPKRNQARQKLSTLQRDRFQQLAMDVFFELERRFPRFGRSASRAESIADRNSPSRQGFPLRSASRTGPDAGPEGFGPRSASRAGPDMGDFGPRSVSRAGPDMDGFGPRSASRAGGPDMGGPDGFQRSASRGPPDMGPDGFGQPPFNGPMGKFQNDQVKPMAKMYQSNVMVPNKGTMIEEDSEAENPKAPNGHGAPFDDIQLKMAELTNKLREKDMELEKAHSEPKELNANFETERSRWNDLRDDLERKVKDAQALNDSIQVELAKVRSEHSTLQRDMRGQEGNQRDVERQLRSALEEAEGNHRAQQDNLKMQLEDVQMQARMKEDVLLSQLEDARNTPTTRGFDDASDQWKSRCDMLEQELAEQRKLTDEVREETSGILQEMRALSQRSADAVEKEDALRDDVARLEKEVRLWKSRYAKSKSQARSLRSSSLGLPVAAGVEGLARDAAFVSDDGVVRDVHVMAFQVAVDEMLQLARGADPEVLTEGMKHVVIAVRHITTDMEAVAGGGSSVIGDAASSVGGQSTITGGPSANRCAKLRARVSTAANNLITATKAHGAAQGIAPVSLVDAAASHLTAAVVEVVRTLKIRRSTADELSREDHDDVVARSGQLDLAATARTMMPPPAGRLAALASFSESSVAGGSAHGRNASGSSAGYSNYSRYSSRYSANTSPPTQVFSGEIKGFGMGMVRENGIEEFKVSRSSTDFKAGTNENRTSSTTPPRCSSAPSNRSCPRSAPRARLARRRRPARSPSTCAPSPPPSAPSSARPRTRSRTRACRRWTRAPRRRCGGTARPCSPRSRAPCRTCSPRSRSGAAPASSASRRSRSGSRARPRSSCCGSSGSRAGR